MSLDCLHQGISRLQAEELLTRARADGSFLIRASESLPGVYVLCLRHKSKLHQYRIVPDGDKRLHIQSEDGNVKCTFGDLLSLVERYIKLGEQNGLICALKHPVNVEKTDEVDTEDEDFGAPLSPPITSSPHEFKQDTQPIQLDLQKNFSTLDLSNCDGEFMDGLKKFVESGIQMDASAIRAGESEMTQFKQLIELASNSLQRELDNFMQKLSICDSLLDMSDLKSKLEHGPSSKGSAVTGSGIPAMLEKMSLCRAEVITLENKAREALRFVQVDNDDNEYQIYDEIDCFNKHRKNPLLSSIRHTHIPITSFQVKQMKLGTGATRLMLSPNILEGKLFYVKTVKDSVDMSKVILQDQIYQLVKCTDNEHRLDLIMAGHKKKTYLFDSAHAREKFCLQVKQMKCLHSTASDVDEISIFIGTWNMGDCPHAQSLNSWLRCTGCGLQRDPKMLGKIPHSLYVFGTQESGLTEKEWATTLKSQIKSSFQMDTELVDICTLWGIRLVILVQREYRHYISRIQKSSVRTGIANALGNKGAVAISFSFAGTSFCFINSHLTSGDEHYTRRNQNYKDIVKGLSVGDKKFELFDITTKFNHVFWVGDLNYRVNGHIEDILTRINRKEIKKLLESDQLKIAQQMKDAFCDFSEADITFMPTYRLQRNTPILNYEWKKIKKTGERINAPSWCDRILWHSHPDTFLENIAYGFAENILSSDHRPVFASFNVGIASEIVMNKDSLVTECPTKIRFCEVEAKMKTSSNQIFYLEFHSTCLPYVTKSSYNSSFREFQKCHTLSCPQWRTNDFPIMKPTFSDQEFLEEQHLLVAVRCKVDDELYGECVIALKNKFSLKPITFQCTLLHRGEETGSIKGQMHVLSGSQSLKRKLSKKSYELVALDTEYHDPDIWRAPGRPGSGCDQHRPPLPHPRLNEQRSVSALSEATCDTSVKVPSLREPVKPSPAMGNQIIPIVSPSEPGPPHEYMTLMPEDRPQLPPPPLPTKLKSLRGKGDKSKSAESVEEWLTGLGLKNYCRNFIQNGYDSISYIQDIGDHDLYQMGIINQDHRVKILENIHDLKSSAC